MGQILTLPAVISPMDCLQSKGNLDKFEPFCYSIWTVFVGLHGSLRDGGSPSVCAQVAGEEGQAGWL